MKGRKSVISIKFEENLINFSFYITAVFILHNREIQSLTVNYIIISRKCIYL
jgi:hypothetical protein